MEYSSDAHSSQPATATQALLTNLGVYVWGGVGLAAILGPLTLTLLPFGWVASLDTFFLLVFHIIVLATNCFLCLSASEISFYSVFTLQPIHPSFPPVIICALKAAQQHYLYSRPLYRVFSTLSSVPIPSLSKLSLFHSQTAAMSISLALTSYHSLLQINTIFSNCNTQYGKC